MINNNHFQSILKTIKNLTYSRDTWEIFYDFLEMSAICISNTVDLKHHEARENQYLSTIKKYSPEHQKLFPEMFAELVLALDQEYQRGNFVDILGNLFHDLELHAKYKGQFFTPQHICDFMGRILLTENDKSVAEQGYISVAEPACGSGAMILGFANAMKECGYNHSQQLFVLATDIDVKCVYMCYLQLSLYGIPAVIIHGNSLTLEEWSRWYTPVYILEGWGWRSRRPITQSEKIVEDVQAIEESLATEEAQVVEEKLVNDLQAAEETSPTVILPAHKEAVKAFEQLDLFSIFNDEGK